MVKFDSVKLDHDDDYLRGARRLKYLKLKKGKFQYMYCQLGFIHKTISFTLVLIYNYQVHGHGFNISEKEMGFTFVDHLGGFFYIGTLL